MGFMQSYKRLDNLCKDTNDVGITGYIEDMERTLGGEYRVNGWKNDYYTLKHYRYVRNQIAHEEYATEENMCSQEDAEWIDGFYRRIMTQTDPLALYQKSTIPRKAENSSSKKQQTVPTSTSTSTYQPTARKSRPYGCLKAMLVFSIIVLVVIAVCLSIKYVAFFQL